MILTMKVRLEPNNKQFSKLFQSAGVARWAYNWSLGRQIENYRDGGKFLQDGILRKELTLLKRTEEFRWLSSYSNNITKQAVKDSCNACKRFFNGVSNRPKFKSRKRSKPSFYQDTAKIKFKSGKVRLEKIGWVRLSEKNRIPEDASYANPRIIFDGLHWYISVGIEVVQEPQTVLTSESVGIDVGIKYLAVCSNKEEPYKNINKTQRVKKLEKRLRRLQRKVSKKYEQNKKGGRYRKTCNIIELEKNIIKLHRRLDNIRTDYSHKITTEIVRTKPSRIVVETLNIRGMLKNKHLSKALSQQKLYTFKQQLKYKSESYNIEFVEADRWFPSSKTCSSCGYIKPKLSLSERTFKCENCGAVIDRDKNASINLSRYQRTA